MKTTRANLDARLKIDNLLDWYERYKAGQVSRVKTTYSEDHLKRILGIEPSSGLFEYRGFTILPR